jgi:hypothetical protein
MNWDSGQPFLSKAVVLAATLVCGVAVAQGVTRLSPGVAPGHTYAPPTYSAPGQALIQRRKVISWFTTYDRIRREAQMTPDERHSAHKLMSDVLTDDPQDRSAGRVLLTRMASRYVRASAQLKALPPMPETAALQRGYQEYFDTGRRVFEKYLQALDSKAPQNVLLQAQQDKYRMGVLDITNKVLDHKLRKQYDVAPFSDQ